jgi:hypothetical protein
MRQYTEKLTLGAIAAGALGVGGAVLAGHAVEGADVVVRLALKAHGLLASTVAGARELLLLLADHCRAHPLHVSLATCTMHAACAAATQMLLARQRGCVHSFVSKTAACVLRLSNVSMHGGRLCTGCYTQSYMLVPVVSGGTEGYANWLPLL